MTILMPTEETDSIVFQSEPGVRRSTSYDLTIGTIVNEKGERVPEFTLKPGHMIMVISKQVFSLPPTITGHVTYKTTMTQKGIWALTVGIVDPGWDGPIATTLLNFSRADHHVQENDEFLRVTLFEHAAVPKELLRKSKGIEEYMRSMRSLAAAQFPTTFLDTDHIAEVARKNAVEDVLKRSALWAAIIAGSLALAAFGTQWVDRTFLMKGAFISADQEFVRMQQDMRALQDRVAHIEGRQEAEEEATSPEPTRRRPR